MALKAAAPTQQGKIRESGHVAATPSDPFPWGAIYNPDSPTMRLARQYRISGRVHRVGFRVFTQAAAAREGIHGWVRNAASGIVEVMAEGDADALERFERALRHGPPAARVDHVDVTDTGAGGRDTGFEVRE